MPPAAPAGLSATGGTGTRSGSPGRANTDARPRGLPRLPRDEPPPSHHGTPLSGANLLSATFVQRHDRSRLHDVLLRRHGGRLLEQPVAAFDLGLGRPRSGSGSNQAVQLNGSSQYLTFGAAPALNASDFTIELWFRRTGVGAGTSTGTGGIASAIPLVTKGRAEAETPANLNMDYFLGIDASTGTLVADFEDTANGTNHPVTGTTAVTSNVWHHAAAVYDTATDTWQLYLDGALDRTLALGGNFTPESTSIQHAAIGSALTSNGTAAGFFQGAVDEVRIWNVPRTGAQIQASGIRSSLGYRPDRPLRPERGIRRDRRLQRRRCAVGEPRGRPGLDRRGAAQRRRQRHERPAVGGAHGAGRCRHGHEHLGHALGHGHRHGHGIPDGHVLRAIGAERPLPADRDLRRRRLGRPADDRVVGPQDRGSGTSGT